MKIFKCILHVNLVSEVIVIDAACLKCDRSFVESMGGARVAQWVRLLDYITTHTSLSPIRRGFTSRFVNYKKRCTRFTAASDIVYQLLAHGLWFSPGTTASSTTKTGRHDIAEILLKVVLSTINQINQIKSMG